MSAEVEAPPADGGLAHLGLIYESPEDLVTTVLPHLRDALERGDTVSVLVDRRTARGLRDALGDGADLVSFVAPADIREPLPEHLRRSLGTATEPDRRVLVLAQYAAFDLSEPALAVGEARIDTLLAGLPLTMLCACDAKARGGALDTVRRSHRRLVRPGARPSEQRNPRYEPASRPATSTTPPAEGSPALRLTFTDTRDLARIRAHVRAVAADAGLTDDDARAAVFAVHEAAVLACDAADGAVPELASCRLEVWTAPGRMVSEVRGPRPPATAADPCDEAAGDPDEARVPRDPARARSPLDYVRLFCRDVTLHEDAETRAIRILTALTPAPPPDRR